MGQRAPPNGTHETDHADGVSAAGPALLIDLQIGTDVAFADAHKELAVSHSRISRSRHCFKINENK